MYNCFTLHLIVLTVPKRNSANGLDVLNELCDVTYCNSGGISRQKQAYSI